MKIHRFLGILWLALCCDSVFNLLRALLELHPSARGLWVAWSVLAGFCLVFLAGIVASIFLFRGANWARWFIVLLAMLESIYGITMIVRYRSFHLVNSVFFIVALVSLVLLFLPRHEPVA
jgi:hypothetical protein